MTLRNLYTFRGTHIDLEGPYRIEANDPPIRVIAYPDGDDNETYSVEQGEF